MKGLAKVVILLVFVVWKCECQCRADLSRVSGSHLNHSNISLVQYSGLLEKARDDACKAPSGLVLSAASLDPVMAVVSDFIEKQSQEQKARIPEKAVRAFQRVRQAVRETKVDLCNDQSVQALVQAVGQLVSRELQATETVLNRFCIQYDKFLQTEQGQQLLANLKNSIGKALSAAQEAAKTQN